MIGKLYQNTINKRVKCRINTGPHDGTTITSIVFAVEKPSGSSSIWDVSIIDAGEDFVLVEHVLLEGDLDEVGYYSYQASAYGVSGFIDISDLNSRDFLVRRGLPLATN